MKAFSNSSPSPIRQSMANLRVSVHSVFFLIWLFLFSSQFAIGTNNETDFFPLMAFKDAIDYDPRGALTSWNETLHFCLWKGILCSKRHQSRVLSINLASQGLVGSLSAHIGNLTFLRNIILNNNSFHGEIPQEMGRLRRLKYIEYTDNSFSGEIPRNLSRCQNLYYLNLNNNKLTGTIPPELGSLFKLEALGLMKNNLSGTIPPSIGNLTSLRILSFMYCNLKGDIPESLVQLRSLEFIQLGSNYRLTGTIPLGLFNISSIYLFEMGNNMLQGYIPPEIGHTLPNLRSLALFNNRFSGTLPASLSNASLLQRLQFNGNDFKSPVLIDFGKLPGLQVIGLAENHFNDDISFISSLANCTRLNILDTSNSHFSGLLPESLANLSNQLYYLDLGGNKIQGNVPSGIGKLLGLTTLDMSNNDLDGPIPSTIGKLTELREIYLSGNRFSHELPSLLGNLTSLTLLFLGANNIHGSIPQSLSNCSTLLLLDLSRNDLNGSIPHKIMIPSITISLNLAYNALTGSIPSEVGAMTNLANLDLSNNRLSGTVPSSLGSCVSLERLHLEENSLHGEIPQSLSAVKGLKDLDLSRNGLTAKIPGFLGELHLEYLNLSSNRLQGEVPNRGIFLNETAVSLVGNNDLCGGNAVLKLPRCSSTKSDKRHFSSLWKILIPTLVAVFIFVMFLASLYRFIHFRKIIRKDFSSMPSLAGQLMRLSYADILKATDGLSATNLIGGGRFGSVYRGTLNNRLSLVAVKVLNLHVKGASRSFISECTALRRVRHRNLLKILSVCSSTDHQGNDFKALIYALKGNGSLDKWLHQHMEQENRHDGHIRNLTMTDRLKIASDVASALEYLHCGTESTIIHGDLKPSNILLDDDMTACLGDFGLTKIISRILGSEPSTHESSSSTVIRGTIGYIAPEYGMSDLVSPEGDVYSYGIVLLEMFTNRKPTDDAFNDNSNLQAFVSSALPDRITEIVDPYLQNEQNMNCMTMKCLAAILSIGVACSKELPKDRMSMANVVDELHKILNAYLAAGSS